MKRFYLFPAFLVFSLKIILAGHADPMGDSPAPAIEDSGNIQKQIEQAAEEGQKQVVIAPGVYRLKGAGAGKAHLEFTHMKDMEIVATGVTLIFTNPLEDSIRFNHCQNITFRGATTIRQPASSSQGTIIALAPDGKSVDVRISPGYPTAVENQALFPSEALNLYDAAHHWLALTPRNLQPDQKLSPDTFRYFLAAGRIDLKKGWAVGLSVAWRGREGPDIAIDDCSHMKIIGVTIENGSGFGVREANGEGYNYYSYTITRGPRPVGATEDPILAINADGFHSWAMRHGPTLENCHFEAMDDDGIAIHGKYGLVQESQGNDVIIRNPYFPRYDQPFVRVGDTLRFNDGNRAFAGEAKVVAIAEDPSYTPPAPPPADLYQFQRSHASYEKITLDRPLDPKFGWLANNANANGDGFIIRGCTVRYNRGRGFLIKASDGLIENCTLEGSSGGGIVITPEAARWNEADFSRNLIVRHNTLINEGTNPSPNEVEAGALTIEGYEHHQFVPLPGGHRNITIEDNTFQNNNGVQIVLTSAQDVTLQNNHFIQPMQHENRRGAAVGINPAALIWMTQCSGVKISGNTLSDPGPFFKTEIDATPTASGTGFTDGVVRR